MLICLHRQHGLQAKGLKNLLLLKSYENNTCGAPRASAELGSLGALLPIHENVSSRKTHEWFFRISVNKRTLLETLAENCTPPCHRPVSL